MCYYFRLHVMPKCSDSGQVGADGGTRQRCSSEVYVTRGAVRRGGSECGRTATGETAAAVLRRPPGHTAPWTARAELRRRVLPPRLPDLAPSATRFLKRSRYVPYHTELHRSDVVIAMYLYVGSYRPIYNRYQQTPPKWILAPILFLTMLYQIYNECQFT